MNTTSIVIWEILQSNAGWDCLKTPILREILRTQNLLPVEHCAFWKSYSLDAGLRLDGIPALDLWDLIVSVLGKHDSEP